MPALARYEARAKNMTLPELRYAMRDVLETLPLHQEGGSYAEKLLAEFDAYSVELSRRERANHKGH